MPNHKQVSVLVSVQTSLGNPRAENRDERRQALAFCITERWASLDVGRIERIDTEEQSEWQMWRLNRDPT